MHLPINSRNEMQAMQKLLRKRMRGDLLLVQDIKLLANKVRVATINRRET